MNKTSIGTYRKMVGEDVYLNNKIHIGYNLEAKGCDYVWYRLSKHTVNKNNIKKRKSFYTDKRLPRESRSHYGDYTGTGYDRGHLASDASFDYSDEVLKDVYVLSNVVPQRPDLNRKVWSGIERYTRYITHKLGYLYVMNVMLYKDDVTIGNGVKVPTVLYKILMNNKHKVLRIFRCVQSDDVVGLKRYLVDFDTFKTDVA